MKRLLSLLCCLCMVLPLLALFPIQIGAVTSTAKISVEKTTFTYGEPIMVTPLVGGANTWIGISPKGKVTSGSMRWMKVETTEGSGASKGAGVGVAVDIRKGAVAGNRYSQADIGPGEWTIFWCQGTAASQYDKTSTIDITVTDDGPITTDKLEYNVGDPIMVTAEMAGENTRTWYGIVPDKGGKPLFSYGTIIYYNLYKALDEGETGNTQDLRAHSGENFGTIANADRRANCAAYLGCTEKTMFLLPAGTYWIVYCADSTTVDGGKAVTHAIQIRIKSVLTTNKTTYNYGEPIMVTPIGEGADWFFIAPKHEDPSKHNWSIRWAYVDASKGKDDNKGQGSGVAIDIRQATHSSNFPSLGDIPPGEYSLFMVFDPNTGAPNADHGTRVDITVLGDIPDAPTGITYTLKDKTTGMAGGKVIVTLDPNEVNDIYNKPSHVILYWGDKNGNKLEDYTYIRLYKVTGATVEIDMPDVTVIPEEAARLMACTYNAVGVSTSLASVALPADRTKVPDKGDLLSSFQIVSDIHTQETQTHKYNQRIAQMLADIKTVDPNSVGIFVSGDAVNDGWVEEYENLIALWEDSGISTPLFLATGNHEWKIGDPQNSYTSDYEREKNRFITYTNQLLEKGGYGDHVITNGKPYYDLWVNGFHYIFLASEAPITHAYLSDAQLAWLREKLAEDRDANRPTFILLHQQMYNAVDGAMPIQDWDGVIAGDANYAAYKARGQWKANGLYEGPFREILAEFPEAMVFSGHSHWDMTDANNIYDPNNPTDVNNNPKDGQGNPLYPETLPNYLFNTAAVAYLVSGVQDEAGKSYSNWNSSKGYYIRVYENCIELWGRDFATGQWVPNAMYRIPLDLNLCTHAGNAACATVCKDCGDALNSTTDHTVATPCIDTVCTACGATVTPVLHAGEHSCSTVCKYGCGTTLTGAAHAGAHPCSETCQKCGDSITPQGNHSYSIWSNHDTAQHKRTCVCGKIEYADHTWNSGSVTKQPSASATGERTHTCTVCYGTKTEEIPALSTENGDGGSGSANQDANSSQSSSTPKDGLPTGAVVATIVAAVLLLGGAAVVVLFVIKKKRT